MDSAPPLLGLLPAASAGGASGSSLGEGDGAEIMVRPQWAASVRVAAGQREVPFRVQQQGA